MITLLVVQTRHPDHPAAPATTAYIAMDHVAAIYQDSESDGARIRLKSGGSFVTTETLDHIRKELRDADEVDFIIT